MSYASMISSGWDVTKFQKEKAAKAFYMATKTDGGEFDEDDGKKGLTPTIPIEINLPSSLRIRAFKNENSVNLLHVATVIYNNELYDKPQIGFGHIVLFLKDEKMEYDFRIHSISFNPTIDLEDTKLMAEVSTTDNSMIQRLVNDKVINFYITGKLTETSDKEIDTIVINKVIAHVDQTVYAKRFAEVKKKNRIMSLPDEIIKQEIFHDPDWDGVKMNGVAEAWKKYKKENRKIGDNGPAPLNKPQIPPPPEQSTFAKWKKAIKSKMVDMKG